MSGDRPEVRAAGGLVWRDDGDGGIEVVLVHRPRYDDWSLPKGKAHKRESDEDTARREVLEETGLVCRLGTELVTVEYETPRGEHKTVRWWEMRVEEDRGFEPDDEVDELRWVPLGKVAEVATMPSDGDVVHSFVTSRR
ncbi:MAG: NUDIX hydrolase [Actinomycetota bacterium]|nr:NUDIX hydrolase [Actinomycetota bacterium]